MDIFDHLFIRVNDMLNNLGRLQYNLDILINIGDLDFNYSIEIPESYIRYTNNLSKLENFDFLDTFNLNSNFLPHTSLFYNSYIDIYDKIIGNENLFNNYEPTSYLDNNLYFDTENDFELYSQHINDNIRESVVNWIKNQVYEDYTGKGLIEEGDRKKYADNIKKYMATCLDNDEKSIFLSSLQNLYYLFAKQHCKLDTQEDRKLLESRIVNVHNNFAYYFADIDEKIKNENILESKDTFRGIMDRTGITTTFHDAEYNIDNISNNIDQSFRNKNIDDINKYLTEFYKLISSDDKEYFNKYLEGPLPNCDNKTAKDFFNEFSNKYFENCNLGDIIIKGEHIDKSKYTSKTNSQLSNETRQYNNNSDQIHNNSSNIIESNQSTEEDFTEDLDFAEEKSYMYETIIPEIIYTLSESDTKNLSDNLKKQFNIYKQNYNINDDNYNELVDITLYILEEYMDIGDHTLKQIKNNIQQREKQELYHY